MEYPTYYDVFGEPFAMFRTPDKATPGYKETEFVVGNGCLTARTGGKHPFSQKINSLTTLDCLYGSLHNPKSAYSFFAWPYVGGYGYWRGEDVEFMETENKRLKEMIPYRCSCFYVSANGSAYEIIGSGTKESVYCSYVLGAAVVKTVVTQPHCSFIIYTYAHPDAAVLYQQMEIIPSKTLQRLKVVLYVNPVIPGGPVITHHANMVFKDALNNKANCMERGILFEHTNYNLFMQVDSMSKPQFVGCRDLNGVKHPERYYTAKNHLLRKNSVSETCGDVEGMLGFDFERITSRQRLNFTYTVGTSSYMPYLKKPFPELSAPAEILRPAQICLERSSKSLHDTVAWWREWLGYHEPSSVIEALIQQGLISLKVMQAKTGAISAGTAWRKCFNDDSSKLIMPLTAPYGNYQAHLEDIKHYFAFINKAVNKYGPMSGGYNFVECDLSLGCGGSPDDAAYGNNREYYYTDICLLATGMREYLKQTGDYKTILKYAHLCRMIGEHGLREAGKDNLVYLHQDSALHHSFAVNLKDYEDSNEAVWPASFDDSLNLAYTFDVLSLLAVRKKDKRLFKKYRETRDHISQAVEKHLKQKNNLYGVITPTGKLISKMTFRHLEHMWRGGVPRRYLARWLKQATCNLVESCVLSGNKFKHVLCSPGHRKYPEWGVDGWYVMAALKCGQDKQAKPIVDFLKETVSAHGTWAEAGLTITQPCGCLNFCWNTGVNIMAIWLYYIGLVPLENGYDRPFQFWPHDLEKIIPVEKSFGFKASFTIERLDNKMYKVSMPFLMQCAAKRYKISADKNIELAKKNVSKNELARGINVRNLSNSKIIIVPIKR